MATKKKKGEDDEKKGKNKKMIIVGVVLAAAGYKFMLAPKPAPKEEVAANGEAVAQKIEEGAVVALPDLTLNLADSQTRYLRVGIALILEKGAGGGGHGGGGIEEQLPIASDVAVDVLSAKTFAELNAPGAKQAVKAELSEKVREAFHGETVARVIFTSFVMQ